MNEEVDSNEEVDKGSNSCTIKQKRHQQIALIFAAG